jgi:hypothetical protein
MGQSVIFGFIALMWALMIVGGGICVILISKISIAGYGEELDLLISSIIKAVIALILVAIWVLVLSKLKNKIFQKLIKS